MAQPVNKRPVAKTTLALLILLEGVSFTPYRDGAGVWTIGAGSTGPDVHANTPRWSQAQVDERLARDAQRFQDGVLKCLATEPDANMLAAFTSVAYNTGLGKPGVADGFCYLKSGRLSTIVSRYNSGDKLGACLAIFQWNKITVNGRKVVSNGLNNRRWKEYDLCIS